MIHHRKVGRHQRERCRFVHFSRFNYINEKLTMETNVTVQKYNFLTRKSQFWQRKKFDAFMLTSKENEIAQYTNILSHYIGKKCTE